MSGWRNSDRRSRLPKDWDARRLEVKRRAGGRCQQELPSGARCPRAGAECDHIEPGDNHDLSNLQWLCKAHHDAKTRREAAAAYRKPQRPVYKRAEETHPALRGGTLARTAPPDIL